jgi:Rab3 GTPase-activating protein catalytic subunit
MYILGELSARMQIPGNMWSEVWHSARPIPARRQRRLFDDTKEAEKVGILLTSQITSQKYYNYDNLFLI